MREKKKKRKLKKRNVIVTVATRWRRHVTRGFAQNLKNAANVFYELNSDFPRRSRRDIRNGTIR